MLFEWIRVRVCYSMRRCSNTLPYHFFHHLLHICLSRSLRVIVCVCVWAAARTQTIWCVYQNFKFISSLSDARNSYSFVSCLLFYDVSQNHVNRSNVCTPNKQQQQNQQQIQHMICDGCSVSEHLALNLSYFSILTSNHISYIHFLVSSYLVR